MDDNGGSTQKDPDQHANVGQAADAQLKVANLSERDGIRDEDEIQDAIDEGLVDGDKTEDWFQPKHDCRRLADCSEQNFKKGS